MHARFSRILSLAALVALLTAAAFAAKPTYASGKIVEVERKSREKVDMYLVNTPMTTEVPYFEIAVELNGTVYRAEYTPRHSDEELPEAWKAGETISCRIDKHHLYLQRSAGVDMTWIITKKSAAPKESPQS